MYSPFQANVVQRIWLSTMTWWYCVRFRYHPLFFIKYLLIGGVDVCPPHVQTVSTSLLSKLVNECRRNFFFLSNCIIKMIILFSKHIRSHEIAQLIVKNFHSYLGLSIWLTFELIWKRREKKVRLNELLKKVLKLINIWKWSIQTTISMFQNDFWGRERVRF